MVIPFLKVSDYVKHLFTNRPKLLFGGFNDGTSLCQKFWENYKGFQRDHEVYTKYTSEEWGHILPIAVHGDKGRTLAKAPIFITNWESVFGLPTDLLAQMSTTERTRRLQQRVQRVGKLGSACGKRARQLDTVFEEVDDSSCPLKRMRLNDDSVYAIPHNAKGSTLATIFLHAAVPSKIFKAHPQAIPAIIEELQRDLTTLFNEGIQNSHGQTLRVAILGIKGCPFQWYFFPFRVPSEFIRFRFCKGLRGIHSYSVLL